MAKRPAARAAPPRTPWTDYTDALTGAGARVRQYRVFPPAFRQALVALVADVARADRYEREADVPDESDALDSD